MLAAPCPSFGDRSSGSGCTYGLTLCHRDGSVILRPPLACVRGVEPCRRDVGLPLAVLLGLIEALPLVELTARESLEVVTVRVEVVFHLPLAVGTFLQAARFGCVVVVRHHVGSHWSSSFGLMVPTAYHRMGTDTAKITMARTMARIMPPFPPSGGGRRHRHLQGQQRAGRACGSWFERHGGSLPPPRSWFPHESARGKR